MLTMQLHHYTQLYNTYATKDLEGLLKATPYFGMAHIVLAKKYYDEKNIAFNEQLKLASLYSNDRKLLYSFIHQPIIKETTLASIEVEVVPAMQETLAINESPIPIDNSAMQALVQAVINNDTTPPSPPPTTNDALAQLVNDVLLNDTNNAAITNESITITQNIEINALDKLTEEQTLIPQQNIPIEDTTPKLETGIVTPLSATAIIDTNEINSSEEVINETLLQPIEITLEVAPNTPVQTNNSKQYKVIHPNDTVSFFEWLNVGNTSVIEHNAPPIVTPVNVNSTPTEVPKSEAQKTIEIKKRKKSLIEKFIIDEPRITPAKAKMYSPAEKAKESVIENDDLVSETLVKIYVQQAMYRKAIRALDKLSEKYPEKSVYFANQITKIKEYLATNNIKY